MPWEGAYFGKSRKRLVCTSHADRSLHWKAHVEYGMRAAPGAMERIHIVEDFARAEV